MLLRVKWGFRDEVFGFGSGDGILNVFNSRLRGLHCRLPGHKGSLNALDFSPVDKQVVATVSNDRMVLLGEIAVF